MSFQAEFPRGLDAEHRPHHSCPEQCFPPQFQPGMEDLGEHFPRGFTLLGRLAEQNSHFAPGRGSPYPNSFPSSLHFPLRCHLLHPSIQTGQTGNSAPGQCNSQSENPARSRERGFELFLHQGWAAPGGRRGEAVMGCVPLSSWGDKLGFTSL